MINPYYCCIADCCSGCSSVRSSTFATFKSSSKMVSEDTALVHIDVYRYGPMERPLILRVIDEPGTALKGNLKITFLLLYSGTCLLRSPLGQIFWAVIDRWLL